MFLNLLPPGYFGPAGWRVLLIVLVVAVIVASLFAWLLVYAARST
jgi:hypothetical protein